MRKIVLLAVMLVLVACDKSDNNNLKKEASTDTKEEAEKQKKLRDKIAIHTIIQDMSKPLYEFKNGEQAVNNVDINELSALLPDYIEEDDLKTKHTNFGNYKVAILNIWDKKPVCMVFEQKEGKNKLISFRQSDDTNLQLLTQLDPSIFKAKGWIKYGDKQLSTNFAIATKGSFFDKPSIEVEFEKDLLVGDLEMSALGHSSKETSGFSQPSFSIDIAYEGNMNPSHISVHHHNLAGGSFSNSIPHKDQVQILEVNQGKLRLARKGTAKSFKDVQTEWDVDIEVPLFESGCEIAFK